MQHLKHKKCRIVFSVVSLILLSACSTNDKETAFKNIVTEPQYEWGEVSGKTITIWGDVGDLERPYNTRSFERYEELTENKIKLVKLSKEELDKKLPLAFSSAEAEKPDILVGFGGTNIEALNPDENFYDFTNAPWVSDLSDTALNHSIYNGKVIGLPFGEASVSGTLYNKKIFKKLGLSIPETQAEFLEVCKVLKENNITPLYLPYSEITMLLYQFPMDSFLRNSTTLDKLNSGEITYSEIPEMKKIVEWYKTMSNLGYFGSDYEKNNWDGMDPAMKNGKYAMMLCWDTWLYTNFTGNPEDFGIMPAFMGVPNEGTFEGANIAIDFVNKNSKNLDATLDYISFLADPYNYNETFKGIYTSPVFQNQIGSITTPQYMENERLIDKLYHDSTAWPRLRGFAQYDAIYIQDYMQGKYDLDTCLKKLEEARRSRAGME